jgi:hypothetical protein
MAAPSDDDLFLIVNSPNVLGARTKVPFSTIRTNHYPESAAETAAGVTPTDYTYEYGNVKRYGAVADSATDDSAAFINAIAVAKQTNGYPVYVPPGDYYIDTEIPVTGRDIRIHGTYGSTLQWNGVSTDSLFAVGDGGTTLTIGVIIEGLSIQDETSGTTKGLLYTNKCDRSEFRDLYFFAASTLTLADSRAITINETTLANFTNIRINNMNTGVRYTKQVSQGTAANYWRGFRIENCNTAGFHWSDTGSGDGDNVFSLSATFQQGSIQGGFFTGFLIEYPQSCLNIQDVYFEDMSWAIDINHTVGQDYVVNVRGNFFQDSNQDAHIRLNGAACHLVCIGNMFRNDSLVRVIKDTSRYFGWANVSVAGDPGTTEEFYRGTIIGVSQANPCVISETAHGYTSGDTVLIRSVVDNGPNGDLELAVNDIEHTVISVSADAYALSGVDTSATTNVYSSGGRSRFQDAAAQAFRIAGDNFLAFDGGKGFKHELHYIPNVETGTASSVSSGGSSSVSFSTPFLRAPKVMAICNNANAGECSVGSITTHGFTVYNHAAGSRNIDWVAFETT